MGQLDPAKPLFEVALVEEADPLEALPGGGGDLFRADGHGSAATSAV
jgi:hypothetical protein